MTQLPDEDDTPFSLPSDTPEDMPIDYPELDSGADLHEVYDEGREEVVDIDPYESDDDPIKSAKRLMKSGAGSQERYTINHDIIRRWAKYRGGSPSRIKDGEGDLDKGNLYVYFEEKEPDIDVELIDWSQFFKIFEKNNLVFVYRSRTRSGELSYFYDLLDRRNVERITQARRVE